MVDTSDEWIVTRSGIRERRIAAADETVATMGFEAAKNSIEAAQINPQDIELIIVATTSHSHAYPSAACQVQGLLNIDDAISFDLAAACTGFVYALSVADQFIRAGKVKKLVMTGGVSRDLQSSAGNMQMIAEKMGVPKGVIIQEREAGNTFENIVFSRKFIENSPRVVIVSAGFHLARARMMADRQWQGHDIQVYAAPFCSEPYGGYGFTVLRESAAFVKNALKGRL